MKRPLKREQPVKVADSPRLYRCPICGTEMVSANPLPGVVYCTPCLFTNKKVVCEEREP